MRSATNDLELVLDRQDIECPAIVKERLLSVGVGELSFESAAISSGFCWLVSRSDLFVWKQRASGRVKSAFHLHLPASGLLYSAKSILVFPTDSSAQVVAISGEGVARHWPSLSSPLYNEATLELGQEVVLSLQMLYTRGERSTFMLTTTSGSVYCLRTRSSIGFDLEKVGGRGGRSIGRRLSSIIFGSSGSTPDSSLVVNSVLLYREDVADDDASDLPIMLTVSAKCLHAFDIANKKLLWTTQASAILNEHIVPAFERFSRGQPIEDVQIWLLDAAPFRSEVIVLGATAHAKSNSVQFFLAILCDCAYAAPAVGWFSMVPNSTAGAMSFDVMDESSFVGRVRLRVPPATAISTSNDRTDGVIILHEQFVQTVYVPDDLTSLNELPLNKVYSLTAAQTLVGHGVSDDYCYVMLSDGNISTIRLLPKGFGGDKDALENSFVELPELFCEGNPTLETLQKAFGLFVSKDMVKASVVMQELVALPNSQLTNAVHTFTSAIIDNSDPDAVTEIELKNKRLLATRFVLFLKHMSVLDKVMAGKTIINIPQRTSRSGASILAETLERVAVAKAVRSWQLANDDRTVWLEDVCAKMAQKHGLPMDGAESLLFDKLSLLHDVPLLAVATCREQIGTARNPADRFRLSQLLADLLMTFAAAVEASRRSTSSVVVPEGDVQWSGGIVADGFHQACMLLISEMSKSTVRTEKTRLRDYVVRLSVFVLSESPSRPDGHQILAELYGQDEERVAVDLAERFKDFRMLCRSCMDMDREARTAKLDSYKLRYAADDFDLYLCQYLKQKNMNEELLEQRGARADQFMSSLDSIRWRRELQNGEFAQASSSLRGLAAREDSQIDRQKALYSLSRLANLCADVTDTEVTKEVNGELELIRHQQNLPANVMQLIYPNHASQRLTISELVEVYRMVVDEPLCEEHHFTNFLSLLSSLLVDEESSEYLVMVDQLWATAYARDDWSKISIGTPTESTFFGGVLMSILDANWKIDKKLMALPDKDRLIKLLSKKKTLPAETEKLIRKACDRAKREVQREVNAE